MARDFNGTTDYIEFANLGSHANVTVACWFTTDQLTAIGSLVGGINIATSDSYSLRFRGDVAGDPMSMRVVDNGTAQTDTQGASSGISAGAWYFALGSASTSATRLRLDVGATSDGGSQAGIQPMDLVWIGTMAGLHNGAMSAIAAWSAFLTHQEGLSLARGFPPRRVRPQSLLLYMPQLRANTQIMSAGGAQTNVGTLAHVDSRHRSYGF